MSSSYQVLENTGSKLVVVMPASSLLSAWLFILLAVITLVSVLGARHSIHKLNAKYAGSVSLGAEQRTTWLIPVCMGGLCFFFWAVSYTSGSLVFDRLSGKVAVSAKMTVFLPARTITGSLDNVDRATLDAKPNSRRIRLAMLHGSDLAYPIWTDRGGQEEAVQAINAFLTFKAGR